MSVKQETLNRGNLHTIYLAVGCFWGIEAYRNKLPGVYDTEVGCANGTTYLFMLSGVIITVE